jgi:hypothetical protein
VNSAAANSSTYKGTFWLDVATENLGAASIEFFNSIGGKRPSKRIPTILADLAEFEQQHGRRARRPITTPRSCSIECAWRRQQGGAIKRDQSPVHG